MKKQFGLIFVLALITNMTFAADYQCKNADSLTKDFNVNSITVSQTTKTEASLSFVTSRGAFDFSNVECAEEFSPDKMLVCVHDQFSFVISLDELPAQAALNPFVFENKEFGPFYFYCDLKK